MRGRCVVFWEGSGGQIVVAGWVLGPIGKYTLSDKYTTRFEGLAFLNNYL